MATIRTKFRPSSVEGREGTLYFQIIHGRVARQINTDYKIFPSEWDEHASEIILSVSDDARRSLLLALKERMKKRRSPSGKYHRRTGTVRWYLSCRQGCGIFSQPASC